MDEGSIVIGFIVAFIFRFVRELEDEIARGNHHNWTFFPNSYESWTAKWVYPLKEYQPKWYHFGVHPKYKERFPFSSTLLVWLTDAEHFYQFVQTVAIILAVALNVNLLGFIAGLAAAQIAKELIKKID